jgi:hypothetical protein
MVAAGGLPPGGPSLATGLLGWSLVVATSFVFWAGWFRGVGGACIVAMTSAYVSFAGGACTSAHVSLGGSVGNLAGGALIPFAGLDWF